MKIPLVATLIVATSAIVLAQQPQRSGEIFSITVYVMDADGQMVLGAEVRAMPADRGGVISQGVTSLGRCTLAVAGPGRYLVYSSKNKTGYNQIDEALAELDPEGIAAVVVSEYLPKAATVVRLRPSAGKLIVKLIDSETGRPLEKAQLILRREHSPNDQFTRPLTPFTRNGTIRMLVPSLPLDLSASAPGYENWSYSDPKKDNPTRLLLTPGETKEITVELRPVSKNKLPSYESSSTARTVRKEERTVVLAPNETKSLTIALHRRAE